MLHSTSLKWIFYQALFLNLILSAAFRKQEIHHLAWESTLADDNESRICDIRVMSAEKLCLMQHSSDGAPVLTVEPLLRKRVKPGAPFLKGLDVGLLPDISDSYVRSVGTPFSKTAFRVLWAADLFLCADEFCNVAVDVRWLDQEEEVLGFFLHMLPNGRLGFGLNYDTNPLLNPVEYSTRPMRILPTVANTRRGNSRRSDTGERTRVIYKDNEKYRRSNKTQFDLYSLRNTAMLETIDRNNSPLVGRTQGPRGCRLTVFPNSRWYRKFVRMEKGARCDNPDYITFIYAPTEGNGAVHCDITSQKTKNSRAPCYNSSWETARSRNDYGGLLVPTTLILAGIKFNVFMTLDTDETEIDQVHDWSVFSSVLRGVVAEGQSDLPSTCLKTTRKIVNTRLDHGVANPIDCRDLEVKVDLESTMEVQENGKTLQDFVTPTLVEVTDDSEGRIAFSGFERLNPSSMSSALDEVQQDMARRAREIEDQFSTRLSETHTTFGAALAFLVALFGVLLAWPSLRDTVNRYYEDARLRIPIWILYLFFTVTVVLGLILPIIVDEAVARQNRIDEELRTVQNSVQLGGFGEYHMVMITSVLLEPLRERKVWIFYSFILALCALLIALGLLEARKSSLRRNKLNNPLKDASLSEEPDLPFALKGGIHPFSYQQ